MKASDEKYAGVGKTENIVSKFGKIQLEVAESHARPHEVVRQTLPSKY